MEVRNVILVKTQHLKCDMPKSHVDEGVKALSMVDTSEYMDKEASSGGKSTFQILTQEDIVLS